MTETIPSIPKDTVLPRLAALKMAPIADLKQQWRTLFGKEPPPFSRTYIQSRLAYRIQELAYGGLKPETVARLEALGEQLDGGNITLRRIRRDAKPIAGTRLVREYQRIEHTVTVLAEGYEWQGRPTTTADPALLKALARAFRWRRLLEDGRYASVSDIARVEQIDRGYAGSVLRLTLLAPDIVEAIMEGRQPAEMGLPALLEPWPVEWDGQQGAFALGNDGASPGQA